MPAKFIDLSKSISSSADTLDDLAGATRQAELSERDAFVVSMQPMAAKAHAEAEKLAAVLNRHSAAIRRLDPGQDKKWYDAPSGRISPCYTRLDQCLKEWDAMSGILQTLRSIDDQIARVWRMQPFNRALNAKELGKIINNNAGAAERAEGLVAAIDNAVRQIVEHEATRAGKVVSHE